MIHFWTHRLLIFSCRRLCRLVVVLGLVLGLAAAPRAEVSTKDFNKCLIDLRTMAVQEGISLATFRQATAGLVPDMKTIERMERQVELTLTSAEYLARQVSDARIRSGRAKLAEHSELLNAIEERYGVDPAIIVAIWGMESSFGAAAGNFPVIQSLATLSCYGRRQPFFRNEFFSALRILEQGDIALDGFFGSWAGAFGQTQFLPTSFERLAVDHSGDGRRDIIGNVPDALASAANYLRQAGWKPGLPWGFAVSVPTAFTPPVNDWKEQKPLSFWQNLGLVRADGSALITQQLSATTPAGLVIADSGAGTSFLVLANFDALHRYNPAVNYALAIAHLADRIRG